MAGPKIVVIGAGSYVFAKPIIRKMAASKVMEGGTLSFVDINSKALATMTKLAKKALKQTNCKVKVESSTNYKDVLKGADFVVLSFSYKNTYYRGIDTTISKKHGITMCSSDTIGPGGIFRAMRELPVAVKIAKDAAKLCPNAWVINYVNPTSVIGMGLRRYASEIRSFALCDGLHEPYYTLNWLKHLNIINNKVEEAPEEVLRNLEMKITGVNHCSFITKFIYKNKDMMPSIRKWMVKVAKENAKNPSPKSKSRYNFEYAIKLFDIYGAYPVAISHTKEYVPFFQGYGIKPNKPEPIICFDSELRQQEMDKAWEDTEQYVNGKKKIKDFLCNDTSSWYRQDHASDIMESMWGNLGKHFYINASSKGSVTNLPYDAFLELKSDVDMNGPKPHYFGEMPRGILGLTNQILDVHEMTAECAMTGDKALLKRAILCDPICNNIEDAESCIKDLMDAQKEILPKYWYKSRK